MRIPLQVCTIAVHDGFAPTSVVVVDAILQCKFPLVDKPVRFLVDTGANHTTLLDHDAKRLKLDFNFLEEMPEDKWTRGVGGAVPSYAMKGIKLVFLSSDHASVLHEAELAQVVVLRHSREEYERIREAPSLLGMDFLGRYGLFVAAERHEAYIEPPDTT